MRTTTPRATRARILAAALAFEAICLGEARAAGDTVSVINDRRVCVLPRPDNAQRVLGHDSGASVRNGAYVYHLFGDTYVDRNGTGVSEGTDFGTGTIAYAKDTDASACVDLTYTSNPQTGLAAVALPLDPSQGECLTWPETGIAVKGTVYVFYTSARTRTTCDPGVPLYYVTGIAKMTNPTTMALQRLGIPFPEDQIPFTGPLRIGTQIYLFGVKSGGDVLLARTPETALANTNRYHYWNGAKFVRAKPNVAKPIFTAGGYVSGPPSVAYNPGLGRFLAVYTCALGGQICARVASTPGETEGALRGPWGPQVPIHSCGNTYASCVHGAQHPAYAQASAPGRIYVTTVRHDGAYDTTPPRAEYRYWNTLHEIDLSLVADKPANRTFSDSELDFGTTQGASGWTYVDALFGDPLAWGGLWFSWLGTEVAGGILPVPRVFADGAAPGPTEQAVRALRFPQPGIVDLTIEVRGQRTCGDGVTVDAEKIHGATITPLWAATLTPGWGPGRGALTRRPVAVEANDQIAFRISARGTPDCDSTVFYASYTYDRS